MAIYKNGSSSDFISTNDTEFKLNPTNELIIKYTLSTNDSLIPNQNYKLFINNEDIQAGTATYISSVNNSHMFKFNIDNKIYDLYKRYTRIK